MPIARWHGRGRRTAVGLISVATLTGLAGPAVAAPAVASRSAGSALEVTPARLSLGDEHVGSFVVAKTATIVNTGTQAITIDAISFRSGDESDFVVGTDCLHSSQPATIAPRGRCGVRVVFTQHAFGPRTATVRITTSAGAPQTLTLSGSGTVGYYVAGRRGGVAGFGDAVAYGQVGRRAHTASLVSITPTTSGAGYWLLGDNGGVFPFGNARFFGSTSAIRLSRPIVGMASPRANNGYWLVASDGGIFAFGRARFLGSTGGIHLNQPIVGMAATRSGHGYWLVARDGGIFTFGDARFFGSTGAIRLAQPIVGMARTPSGKGYWLVARDGGVFTFGDAKFFGSGGGMHFGDIVGIASTPDGRGYWMSNTSGQVFVFGDAPFFGDLFRHGVTDALPVAPTSPTIGPIRRAPRVIYEPNAEALNSLVAPADGRASMG